MRTRKQARTPLRGFAAQMGPMRGAASRRPPGAAGQGQPNRGSRAGAAERGERMGSPPPACAPTGAEARG